MPTDTLSPQDLGTGSTGFRAGTSKSSLEGALHLPNWGDAEWQHFFNFTSGRRVPAGDALIQQGEPDRTLYFVLHGELEVIAHSGNGLSLGRLARVGAGSILGEQAFFDGGPRSAGAWALADCDVAAMTPDQYGAFEDSHPALARDLLFALGRLLAVRLRRTSTRLME